MASTSQQSDSHKGATVSSSYDMGFGESDYESHSSDSDLDDESAMSYWLGKKYFECVIAQCLLVPKNMNQQGMAKIDVLWPPARVQWQKLIVSQVKLEGTLRGYPYDVGFKELRAHDLGGPGDEVRGVDDAYQAMMIGIGHVVRRGTRDQRTVLLATIRRHTHLLMTSVAGDSDSIGGMPERHEWESSSFQITPEGGHTASLPNLGQYATKLKEYGDQRGWVPEYVVERRSEIPPEFRAILSCQDFTFEGTSRTKKQARHQAAREACLFFKLSK